MHTRSAWCRSRSSLRFLVVVSALSGCGGDGGPTPPITPIPSSIAISSASHTLTSLGETVRLSATVKDQRGESMQSAVTWTSSDYTVVRVADGVVTAVANGNAQVTAVAGTVNATAAITVRQEPWQLVVTPTPVELTALGATFALSAQVKDQGGAVIPGAVVTWNSSTPEVATVSSSGPGTGVVTAVTVGTANIAVSNGETSATVAVTVRQDPAQLSVAPGTVSLNAIGATAPLSVQLMDARGNPIPGVQVTWLSSAPVVATVASTSPVGGLVTAVSPGTATVTARTGALTASATVNVAISSGMVVEAIDPYLATPAAGFTWEMPVLVVRYLPTPDGINLDIQRTGFPRPPSHPGGPATLSDIRKRIDVFDRRVKFMLEEGSRFRGYTNLAAPPSLGYRIVQYITVYEPLPLGREAGLCDPTECQGSRHFPDYHAILQRVNAEYWVNTRGVKEIWVWGYHFAGMVQPESNMSSPTTGDISNSYRWNDDLPIYGRTYTVYGYNYGRGHNEAVHNHGHQLEAILGHVEPNLFWKSFVGQSSTGTFVTGRAGWTHMPPNTLTNYDYLNRTAVSTDIEDWRADNSGTNKALGSDRWRNLVYNWPLGNVPDVDGRQEDHAQGSDQRTEAQWYIYWMQNMPGLGNAIPFFGGQMTNWWQFTGDWDASITGGAGLATVPNGFPIEIRNDFFGGILLSPGGGLEPGQSLTFYSPVSTTVSVWNCGKPGESGCIMDPYTVQPWKKYKVVTHPGGPAANLTIVEQ